MSSQPRARSRKSFLHFSFQRAEGGKQGRRYPRAHLGRSGRTDATAAGGREYVASTPAPSKNNLIRGLAELDDDRPTKKETHSLDRDRKRFMAAKNQSKDNTCNLAGGRRIVDDDWCDGSISRLERNYFSSIVFKVRGGYLKKWDRV